PACRLCRGLPVVADLAGRSARGANQGAAGSHAHHLADDQRLAACLARADARDLYGFGIWPRRRRLVGPAPGGRQCGRDARRGSRGVDPCARRSHTLGQDKAYLSSGAAAVRPSLRFLGLAMFGWAGFRAATLGVLPGAEIFRIDRSDAKAPAIVPTQFPPIDPIAQAPPTAATSAAFPYPQP